MEKGSPRKKMKGQYLCIPRLRGNSTCSIKSNRLSPMTLLERFREAVFRLMMISALSKATRHNNTTVSSPNVKRSYCYPPNHHHHTEAVADCIEFIKKTALAEPNRDSNVTTASSAGSMDGPAEMVLPVTVM